jgi:hypothetical protein
MKTALGASLAKNIRQMTGAQLASSLVRLMDRSYVPSCSFFRNTISSGSSGMSKEPTSS